jgi:hypothetical protein
MWFRASDGVMRLYGLESGTGRTAAVLAEGSAAHDKIEVRS